MRILIADDDLTCRVILRKSLERLGHQVIETEDGGQAWKEFQETCPEVVISDWMMPGKDGLALCDAIRSQKDTPYTYFVLLTALNDKDSVLKGLEAGADDYLTKPLDPKELQARLISAHRVTELHRELARLNNELYREGRIDPLTRVGNRRCMQEELELMFNRAKRYQRPFAIALCDIDYFKKYNDYFGHLQGDKALQSIASILKEEGRLDDRIFRYGGEEFLILLPEQTLEGACRAMERRRLKVHKAGISHPAALDRDVVTISVGIAVYIEDEDLTLDGLIKRADQALYGAKDRGRNCSETAKRSAN